MDTPRARCDKGRTRKVKVESLAQAIEQVLAGFRDTPPAKARLYHDCLERGLLHPDQISTTSFNRLVNRHELLQGFIITMPKIPPSSCHFHTFDRRGL